MKVRYLLLALTFAGSALADGARLVENVDLKAIIQEATTALKTSATPQDVAATLKSRTYGKQISVTGASVTDLREMDMFSVTTARQFTGVYTLAGKSYPEPSSLDAQRIAETLRELMAHATWRPDPERIGCSGAGLVILNLKQDQTTVTYNLLTSTYTFRRLRLGQLVSVEATISGVSMTDGRLDVFGVIKHIDEP